MRNALERVYDNYCFRTRATDRRSIREQEREFVGDSPPVGKNDEQGRSVILFHSLAYSLSFSLFKTRRRGIEEGPVATTMDTRQFQENF